MLRGNNSTLPWHGSNVWQHQIDLPNAQGYGISSREVSNIEPTADLLLANVQGGVDIDRSDIIGKSKQAEGCQRSLL